MYCTVETIEDGIRQCMAVPKTWVINNVLYYPKTKSELISARKIRSKPEANWNLMECKVLSNNIGNILFTLNMNTFDNLNIILRYT